LNLSKDNGQDPPNKPTVDQIIEQVHHLYIETEADPDNKGAIALNWFRGLPKELWLLGAAVYGIAKERPVTEQNVNIHGDVANLNLGQQFGDVIATVTKLAADGGKRKEVAEALQAIAEGVKSSSLGDGNKAELLEGLKDLGDSAAAENPKKFSVVAALKYLPTALAAVGDLDKLWAAHGPVIVEYFHHLIGA
jgi:hypothetical protein